MSTTAGTLNRGRWQIIALVALFFGPAILAWVMIWTGWRPGMTVNHGELVEPPVLVSSSGWETRAGDPIGASYFAGRWTLLAVEKGVCATDCLSLLDTLQRVRLALDKDAGRVRILLVQPAGTPEPDLGARPERTVAVVPPGAVDELLAEGDAGAPGRMVHLVDYRGYRMMRYPVPLDASGLLNDMERLLRAADEKVERHLRSEAEQ